MKNLKRVIKGNKTSELTGQKWANGTPVKRLIYETCDNFEDSNTNEFYEPETYVCPNTGMTHLIDGQLVENG